MAQVVKDRESPTRAQRAGPKHDLLLAIGLVLYPSTQFRLGGVPFGPGELLLIIWVVISLGRRAYGPTVMPSATLLRIASFWFVLVVAESIGMLVGFSIELFQDWHQIRNDVIAYTLMIALGLALAIEFADKQRRRRLVWTTVWLGSGSLTLQVLQGYGLPGPPGVETWYFHRFLGWSENPNQLAFLATVITVLSIHLADTARTRVSSFVAVILSVVPIIVGLLTDSDSFIVSMLAATAAYVALKSVTWLRATKLSITPQGSIVAMSLLFLPLVIIAAAPFGSLVRDQILAESAVVYTQGDQGDVRIALWQEAAEKGMMAGMLGMGPGPHLTSKSYKRTPPEKFEAHNTPLDLFTQGGFLAIFAYIWLGASAFGAAWRARLPTCAAIVCGLMAFSMFHFIIRHPIFWFAIVLCLLEAGNVRKAAHHIAGWPAGRREGHVQ